MKKNNFVLKVGHLSAGYHDKSILNDISFEVPEGCRCAILGPNGAGKTTLLKSLLDIHPYIGSISFWNKKYSAIKNKIAYVPQKKNIDWTFPITVKEVVLMGAYNLSKHIFKSVSKETLLFVDECLIRLDLFDLKDMHISELSGGQQQRVFIARALAQKADLYIFDEPFSGLDKISEEIISNIFKELKEESKTIICVHHDWQTIEQNFDWTIFINKYLIYNGPYDPLKFPLSLERTFYRG